MALRCLASIVEYPRTPESKPLRREADTRRAVCLGSRAPLTRRFQASARLCACTSYSVFKEPAPPLRVSARRHGIQATAHPAWSGVPNRYFRPCLGEPSYTTIVSSGCQHLVAPRQASLHSAKAAARSDVGRPSVVVSDLGARTAGNLGTSAAPEREQRFDERRRRISILRAGGGSVNPRCHCSRAISLLSPVTSTPARVTQRLPHIR